MRVMGPAYAVFWVNKIGFIVFLILPHMLPKELNYIYSS